jgi:hypothetical protein
LLLTHSCHPERSRGTCFLLELPPDAAPPHLLCGRERIPTDKLASLIAARGTISDCGKYELRIYPRGDTERSEPESLCLRGEMTFVSA